MASTVRQIRSHIVKALSNGNHVSAANVGKLMFKLGLNGIAAETFKKAVSDEGCRLTRDYQTGQVTLRRG